MPPAYHSAWRRNLDHFLIWWYDKAIVSKVIIIALILDGDISYWRDEERFHYIFMKKVGSHFIAVYIIYVFTWPPPKRIVKIKSQPVRSDIYRVAVMMIYSAWHHCFLELSSIFTDRYFWRCFTLSRFQCYRYTAEQAQKRKRNNVKETKGSHYLLSRDAIGTWEFTVSLFSAHVIL